MLRRKLASLAIAAAITLGLTALALPAMAQDKILKFVSWQKDEPGTKDWYAALIKEFEATHPGVKIEWTKVERGVYAETMTTLFAGGKPPDIVHLASFEYQSFADNGWLADLTPYLKKSNIDMTGWAGQQVCQWQKITACVMMSYVGYVMAYNEDMLAKANITPPKTMAEFIDAARKLTKDTGGHGMIDQYGTALENKSNAGQFLTEFMPFMLDAHASWTDNSGKLTIDTPQMITALQQWKTMVKEGLTPRDIASSDARQLFADGKVALRIDGPQIYPIMLAAKPEVRDHLKMTMPPSNPPPGGSSNVLALPAEGKPETNQLAWDFIALSLSDKFQTLYATIARQPPPSQRADLTEAKQQVPQFDLLTQSLRAAAAGAVDRLPHGFEIKFNEFAKAMFDETQRMVTQDLKPADVVKTMTQRAQQIRG